MSLFLPILVDSQCSRTSKRYEYQPSPTLVGDLIFQMGMDREEIVLQEVIDNTTSSAYQLPFYPERTAFEIKGATNHDY